VPKYDRATAGDSSDAMRGTAWPRCAAV